MNYDVKQAFISTRKSQKDCTLNASANYLKRMSPHEERLGKDLCEFTFDEMVDIYKTDFNCTVKSYTNVNTFYKKYTDFCIKNYADRFNIQTNAYKMFDKETFESFADQLPALKEDDFRQCLKDFINPVDKFMCVAVLSGMKADEIAAAKYEDVHNHQVDCYKFDENNIRQYTRTIPVTAEFEQYAFESANTYEIIARPKGKIKKVSSLLGDYIVKTHEGENDGKIRRNTVRRRFTTIKKQTNNILTVERIKQLGMYYFMRDHNITDKDDVTPYMRDLLRKQFDTSEKYNIPKVWIDIIESHQ